MPVVFRLYGLFFSSISVKSTNPILSTYFICAHIDNNVLLPICLMLSLFYFLIHFLSFIFLFLFLTLIRSYFYKLLVIIPVNLLWYFLNLYIWNVLNVFFVVLNLFYHKFSQDVSFF